MHGSIVDFYVCKHVLGLDKSKCGISVVG